MKYRLFFPFMISIVSFMNIAVQNDLLLKVIYLIVGLWFSGCFIYNLEECFGGSDESTNDE